ncbi:chromosome partitioning protein ParB, partial [Acinetobacter nosocomialis]
RTSITNYLRLLKLDPIIQTGIRDGMISMGHGRALMAIDDTDLQFDIYEKIVKNNLSVRDTERLIKSIKEGKPEKKATNELPSQYKEALSSISNSLNTKVEIKRANNGKGKIILN